MKRILLATRNEDKVRELRDHLAGLDVRVETLAAHPEAGEVEETGDTFEENAAQKASGYARETGMWAIAEDSGLEVDALGGEPGVRSARYAGVHGDDTANNTKLLAALEGKRERGARYRCVMALARPDGRIVATAHGHCEGKISVEARGAGGFGYDPLFVPERVPERTMAELVPHEKDAISHRGAAVRAFIPLVRAHLDEVEG